METKLRILVVEDDDISRQEFGKLLMALDNDVVLAANGQEAVDICSKDPNFSVVFMDNNMPVMNGHTATPIIKRQCPKLLVVSITGESDIKDMYQTIGYDSYVLKPLTLDKIKQLLDFVKTNINA